MNKRAAHIKEVTAYALDFISPCPKCRHRITPHVIALVVDKAMKHGVDPLLVAVTISIESSWKPSARGRLGEVGLMQVYSKAAKKGYNLRFPSHQIDAGAKWLGQSIWICGNVAQGVNRYATGKCKPRWKMLRYRLRKYRAAVRKYRVGQ
jgi:hypothetical protein